MHFICRFVEHFKILNAFCKLKKTIKQEISTRSMTSHHYVHPRSTQLVRMSIHHFGVPSLTRLLTSLVALYIRISQFWSESNICNVFNLTTLSGRSCVDCLSNALLCFLVTCNLKCHLMVSHALIDRLEHQKIISRRAHCK